MSDDDGDNIDYDNLSDDDLEALKDSLEIDASLPKFRDPRQEDGWRELDPAAQQQLLQRRQAQHTQELADWSIDRWTQENPVEVQQAAVDAFVESGDLSAETFGIEAVEMHAIEQAFTNKIEADYLKPAGITMDDWQSMMDPADEPEFRRLIVTGKWDRIADHIARCAMALRQHN